MAPAPIALLEDDEDLRESVVEVFGMLGRKCLALASVEAMKQAQKDVLACGCIILDVNLGEGEPSGVEAHDWLRQQQFGGRIVFLTGHASSHPLVARASKLGEPVLEKPISAPELTALVGKP